MDTTTHYQSKHNLFRPTRPRDAKSILIVGFLGLIIALIATINSPATGYEFSIYWATPVLFWTGSIIAFVAALIVGFSTLIPRYIRTIALVLAGTTGLAIVALPLLRGYYFYGKGDSLSHLGFAQAFAEGSMSPVQLLHPGVQLTSVIFESATGASLRWSMLFTVLLFFVLFFIFVPLCVKQISGTPSALSVGLFAALLLLPINAIGTHIVTHPSSQAILYTPFILYLLFVYLRQPIRNRIQLSRIGILLVLASATILLIHPQETMNILVIFGTVAVLQFTVRRIKSEHPLATLRSVYFQSFLLGILWILWAPRSPRVEARFDAAHTFIFGGSTTPAATEIAGRTTSLEAVGGSIEMLFLKLFFVGFLFSIIAGAVMATSLLGRLDDVFPEENTFNKYLTFAFVPLFIGTLFVFLGDFGDHYFRFIGFLMVIVTIIAAAALSKIDKLVSWLSARTARRAILVLFIILLPVALMSLHPSPWIYQDTNQVTEQTMDGYRIAFEQNPGNIEFAGIRGTGTRYVQALYGVGSPIATGHSGDEIPPEIFASNLTSFYDDPRYIPVTQSDIERETRLYHGFRYGLEGFHRLETTPGIHRVQSTGEFQLYLLPDE